jgi:hypothetical protein
MRPVSMLHRGRGERSTVRVCTCMRCVAGYFQQELGGSNRDSLAACR